MRIVLMTHGLTVAQAAATVARLEADGHTVDITDEVPPSQPEPQVFEVFPMPSSMNWPPAVVKPSRRGRACLRGDKRPWKRF